MLEEKKRRVTKIPTARELFFFTLPQAALMLCHLAISMTDLWVAGQLGNEVVTSLGIVSQIFAILMLFASFAGTGASTAISQSLGAGRYVRASRYVASILQICFISGSIVAFIGMVLFHWTNVFNGDNDALQPIIHTFTTAYCANLPFFYVLIMINSVFRAHTYVRIPCQTLFLVCIINLIASLAFGLGKWGAPNYGYAGVAWATFASGIVGLCYNCFALWRTGILTRRSFTGLRWNAKALPYVFRTGIPAAIGSLASQSSGIITLFIILSLPMSTEYIIAGMTIGMRVQSILHFGIAAFGISMSIYSGHLLGGRKYDELYLFARKSLAIVFIVMTLLSALFYALSHDILQLISNDFNTLREASYFMSFACFSVPFMALTMLITSIFSGTGAQKLSAKITVLTTWCLQIPLAYAFSKMLDFGIGGIYLAGLIAHFCLCIALVYLFFKKTWLNFGLRHK